jgi:hypothetical protein
MAVFEDFHSARERASNDGYPDSQNIIPMTAKALARTTIKNHSALLSIMFSRGMYDSLI